MSVKAKKEQKSDALHHIHCLHCVCYIGITASAFTYLTYTAPVLHPLSFGPSPSLIQGQSRTLRPASKYRCLYPLRAPICRAVQCGDYHYLANNGICFCYPHCLPKVAQGAQIQGHASLLRDSHWEMVHETEMVSCPVYDLNRSVTSCLASKYGSQVPDTILSQIGIREVESSIQGNSWFPSR